MVVVINNSYKMIPAADADVVSERVDAVILCRRARVSVGECVRARCPCQGLL